MEQATCRLKQNRYMEDYVLRSIPLAAFALMLAMSPSPAEAEPLSLQQAIEIARQANPALAAKQASALAADEVPTRMGAWPDPMVFLGLMSSPPEALPYGKKAMTRSQIGFSQMIPFPGKLGLESIEAGHMARAAHQMKDDLRLQIDQKVQMAWWSVFYMDRGLENISDNQQLLRQLIRVAESKYKLGAGLQQDVLLAQLELSKMLDEQIVMVSERKIMAEELNALLGRAVPGSIEIPRKVDETLPELLPMQALVEKTLANRPMLAGIAAEKEAAQARVDSAEKGYYPDFQVTASYESGDVMSPGAEGMGMEQFNLMLGATVPLFGPSKQARLIAQRKKELAAAGFMFEDARNMAITTVTQTIASYQRAKEQADLLRTGIIPQASQTAESMRSGYEVNKVDFLNLVMAQITLYNYQTRYWKTLAEANQALATLAAAVGEENVHE